ncbi:metalloregulator ArsR/SmtB family transcription factor [Pelagibius sp. CAU 1746]|uniref:ArsR/SmtB family transcription factor n=1 Tax=Pelagibius sp. CAU 1746 TaxID=3140370 RepID=UPI00325AE076
MRLILTYMDNNSSELDTVFHAFADSTRRAVLRQLGDGPASVSDLAAPFDMALPPFMKHIRTLENAGLITTRKVGRVRICELNPEKYAAVEEWLKGQRKQWASRYRKLDQLLEQLKGKNR